jgi:hypothetical protein
MALESASAVGLNMIKSAEKMEHDTQQPRCQICRDLNATNLPLVDELPRRPIVADVEGAAKDGCLGCDVLVKVLRHHFPEVEKQQPVNYIKHGTAPPTVKLSTKSSSVGHAMIGFEFLSQQGTLFFTPNIFSYSIF